MRETSGVTSMPDRDDPAGFTEVLTAWSWWDVPRNGVVRIDGHPHRFRCDFDEALDDYPEAYQVWAITEAQLAADLALWDVWVDWRRRYDRGENPEPFDSRSNAIRDAEPPTGGVRMVIPEWRLDTDRSFAVSPPRHLVRFAFDEPG
jgi:hypothetical protein